MLVSLSIILLILGYRYQEKLILFNDSHRSLTKRLTQLEKYQDYQFFGVANKARLNQLKTDLTKKIKGDDDIRKVELKLFKLEQRIIAALTNELKKDYHKIISKELSKQNQYRKLNLSKESNKSYHKMIAHLFKDKKRILSSETANASLIKLFEKYQLLGVYQTAYSRYQQEDHVNNLKVSTKRDKLKQQTDKNADAPVIPEQNSGETMKKATLKTFPQKENNACLGALYQSKKQALHQQNRLLAKGLASSLYQIKSGWCLVHY